MPERLTDSLQNVALAGVVASQVLIELKMRRIQKNLEKLNEKAHGQGEEKAPAEEGAQDGESLEQEVSEGQRLSGSAPA